MHGLRPLTPARSAKDPDSKGSRGQSRGRVSRAIEKSLTRRSQGMPSLARAPAKDASLSEIDRILDAPLARAWLSDGFAARVDVGAGPKAPGVIAALPRRKHLGGGGTPQSA